MKEIARACLWVTLAVVLIWGQDSPVVADLTGQTSRYQCTVGDIAVADFLTKASELLGAKSIRLGVVANYGTKPDRYIAGTTGMYECNRATRQLDLDNYRRANSGCPEVQEVVKVGPGIVYRSQGKDCRITKKVLQGDDPLTFVVDGQRVEILEIGLFHGAGAGNEHSLTADVYVRSNGVPTEALAQAVLAHVMSTTGVEHLFVWLRPDLRFFASCNFPTWFPFEHFVGLPNPDDQAGSGFACSTMGKGGCQRY